MSADLSKVQSRDGGIEIFRCVLMFLIVLHHCCLHGSLATTLPSRLLSAITNIGVDGFVAITGWYGINFTWKRFSKIWFYMLFYVALFFPLTHEIQFWWFASAYLCLMLVAPLLNAAIKALSVDMKQLLHAWALYAIAITLSLKPFAEVSQMDVNGWGAHTVNTLIFVYMTMGVLRLAIENRMLPKINYAKVFLWTFVLFVCGAGILFTILKVFHLGASLPPNLSALKGYDSPFIWGAAIIAFLYFKEINVQKWGGGEKNGRFVQLPCAFHVWRLSFS